MIAVLLFISFPVGQGTLKQIKVNLQFSICTAVSCVYTFYSLAWNENIISAVVVVWALFTLPGSWYISVTICF